MASFSPGRNIGRLSIRVVPDTNGFRHDLKRRLDQIARTTKMTINVDKANLDRVKIREDIRRQTEGLKGIEIDANVRVTVDRAKLKKKALRKSIQDEFDKFENIAVKISAEIHNKEHFYKEVRDMVQRASRNQVDIRAAAHTLAASAQLAWVSRDRFVNLIVRVTKSSVTAALTTLAALSGARLSWKWIDDLGDMIKDLDKNLPSILGWTTGITSLFAAVFAATSGLVGIGQGLFSILPAFLTLPGLLLNAVGSVTALVVALRHAGDELSPLKDDMSELADIINAAFWDQARQPIIDLITGLMPQLRTAFHDLSLGIGEFTGAMSRAFGEELANGRLASIFNGIAEGWRVLGTGASGFAGALVSLSQIAATYTPRLAAWFVRQANTFDAWLEAIAEDGRLGRWMENAISSMYDLWDATTGIAGVFEGLWRAAELGGSKGLAGFADLMQTWERTVKSADFQRGMSAVFRGSTTAMGAFGDAIRAIGRLVADLDGAFEKFIGTAGIFFAGIFGASADALSRPSVDTGLRDLSDGLLRALEGIKPALEPIADTFGRFLSLLGDLAGSLLPTAANVLAELMPSIDSLISTIRDSGILDTLGEAIVSIAEALSPAIEELVDALGPILVDALTELAQALVDIAPVLAQLIDALADFVTGIGKWVDGNESFINGIREWMGVDVGAEGALKKLTEIGAPTPVDDGNPFTIPVSFDFNRMWNDNRVELEDRATGIAKAFVQKYEQVLAAEGPEAAQALVDAFREIDGLPPEVITKINEDLQKGFTLPTLTKNESRYLDEVVQQVKDAYKTGGAEGAQAMWDELTGFSFKAGNTDNMRAWARDLLADADIIIPEPTFAPGSKEALAAQAKELTDSVVGAFRFGGTDAAQAMWDDLSKGLPADVRSQALADIEKLGIDLETLAGGAGGGMSRGLVSGFTLAIPLLEEQGESIKGAVTQGFAGSEWWLVPQGQAATTGFQGGMTSGLPALLTWLAGLQAAVTGSVASSGTWLVGPGGQAITGMQAGAVAQTPALLGSFSGLRGSVVGAVGDAGGWLYGVGQDLIGGMVSGVLSMAVSIANAAASVVSGAVSAAKRAGEINSPSRLTAREIGAPLAQGVAIGIEREAAGIRRSMETAVDLSGVTGATPVDVSGRTTRGGVNLHIHSPIVRDLKSEAREAAQIAGVLV